MRLYKKKHVIVVFPDRLSYVNVERGEWVNVLLQSAAKNWCVFWLPIISQVCRYVLVLSTRIFSYFYSKKTSSALFSLN